MYSSSSRFRSRTSLCGCYTAKTRHAASMAGGPRGPSTEEFVVIVQEAANISSRAVSVAARSMCPVPELWLRSYDAGEKTCEEAPSSPRRDRLSATAMVCGIGGTEQFDICVVKRDLVFFGEVAGGGAPCTEPFCEGGGRASVRGGEKVAGLGSGVGVRHTFL